MKKRRKIDYDLLFLCAFRYALGRKTYVVESVTSMILGNLHRLRDVTLKVIIRDLKDKEDLGDVIDKTNWMRFHDIIEDELLVRGATGETYE